MTSDTQAETIALLSRPEAWGADAPVERIETHGAIVFLAGDRAYKMKRAVRYSYLDYSTVALRRAAVEAELAVNRRTAPQLYLRAVPVVRTAAGALAVGGDGEAVDWLVEMRRFDQAALFDRLAEAGALDAALIEATADAVAAFHAEAEIRAEFGGAGGIGRVLEENREAFAELAEGLLDPTLCAAADEGARALFAQGRDLLEARRAAGKVRACHGDLHLRNLCLIDGRPTLFDAIEFNDDIACVDVLFDLAFLVQDLDRVGLRPLAHRALDRYLMRTGDLEGLAALPLFLSCRAAIRAQTLASSAIRQSRPEQRAALLADARACLDQAVAYARPVGPCLVAIGGLSGTGKTTLAHAVAPHLGPSPGALVLRSDVIRKRLAGAEPLHRLPLSAYGSEGTAQVYHAQLEQARTVLAAGHAAVADAVFAQPRQRQALAALAAEHGVPFIGLWLEAPQAALTARVAARRNDASDATVEVVRAQSAYQLGAIDWQRIDSGGTPHAAFARARDALQSLWTTTGSSRRSHPTEPQPRQSAEAPMPIRQILAVVSGTAGDQQTLAAALTIARRFNSHIQVAHAHGDPHDAVPFLGEGATAALIEQIMSAAERDAATKVQRARANYEAWRSVNGLTTAEKPARLDQATASWKDETAREDELVGRLGRLSDMIVLEQPSAQAGGGSPITFEAAILDTGRPVLVVPPSMEVEAIAGVINGPIVISWNGSPQAARAVAGAMPILSGAKDVKVVMVTESDRQATTAEMVDYLAWHGIAANHTTLVGRGTAVGEGILAEAINIKASLLVMGAYTHSRVRQMVFGGVTRHVLNNMTLPVLMAR